MVIVDLTVFIFGLVFGSFFNVCIYRLPLGMSVAFPPSHCPACDHALSPLDLVPVASYLVLRGKCRYCGGRISLWYPLVELLTGIIFLLIYRRYGLSISSLYYIILASFLIIISYIDIDHGIIPDRLVLAGLAAGVAIQLLTAPRPLADAALGFLAGGLPLLGLAVVSNGGMGGGDIKLAAMFGWYLGWKLTLLALFAGFLSGGVYGIALVLAGRRKLKGGTIPFGPFLALGAMTALLFGQEILVWYTGVFWG